MIEEQPNPTAGIKDKLMVTFIVLGILIVACVIAFTILKIINSGKKPEPLSRFDHGFELTIQNLGTLPFMLNNVEFSQGAVVVITIHPESHMADVRQRGDITDHTGGITKTLALPDEIPVSDQTWQKFQKTPITSTHVTYALFGGLFTGPDRRRPQLTLFITDLNAKKVIIEDIFLPIYRKLL